MAAKLRPRARAFAVAAALLTQHAHAAALTRPRSGPQERGGATVTAETRWAEETLKALTTRERIGQLIVTAVQLSQTEEGGGRVEEARRQVTELGLGGVLVRGGNPESVAALTNELQRSAKVPLLVAADYERGLRMQMKRGTPFTYAMAVAATGDPSAAYTQGKIIAREARAVGVNWLLGPVADVVNNNPDDPVINVRSYGEDPRRVAEFVRGARERPVAVIAFSGPYLIRQFPEVKTYATAYGIEEVSQAAGVRALLGETPFRGRLPVSIPGLFQVGAGIRTGVSRQAARGLAQRPGR